ncbi:hypothetical protein FO519_004357 [Halicephalobus sp. NKZ332]|nr:hypothetical protein FO519_004357 [Halicephalobus sp. NKZ332]
MKLETCVYSGYKIHPGHGKRIVRTDGKVQIFLNKRCVLAAIRLKRNPRDIPWTVLYRRKYKKGIHADANTQKKRVKRTVQVASRPIGDVSVEALLAKRNQKPEFRKAQREQAVKVAKDALRAKQAEKKAKKAADHGDKAKAAQQKAAKHIKSAQPRVDDREMSVADRLGRLFLLSLFVWNQIVHYPIPLSLIDRETVTTALEDFDRGTCPFVVSPPFGKNDFHMDKYRRVSYNYNNVSLLVSKAIYYFENEVGRDPASFVENFYLQLTATIPSTMSQNFLKILINDQISFFGRMGFVCIPFSTLASGLLLIAFCHIGQIEISGIYTLFIVLDSLILSTRSWYFLSRVLLAEKEQKDQAIGYKQFLFKMLVVYIGDLLEVIFNSLSIFFGLFIRKRLMALLLVSQVRRLLQRILFFEYPEASELPPELRLALV